MDWQPPPYDIKIQKISGNLYRMHATFWRYVTGWERQKSVIP